jgi:hypothetical protein
MRAFTLNITGHVFSWEFDVINRVGIIRILQHLILVGVCASLCFSGCASNKKTPITYHPETKAFGYYKKKISPTEVDFLIRLMDEKKNKHKLVREMRRIIKDYFRYLDCPANDRKIDLILKNMLWKAMSREEAMWAIGKPDRVEPWDTGTEKREKHYYSDVPYTLLFYSNGFLTGWKEAPKFKEELGMRNE